VNEFLASITRVVGTLASIFLGLILVMSLVARFERFLVSTWLLPLLLLAGAMGALFFWRRGQLVGQGQVRSFNFHNVIWPVLLLWLALCLAMDAFNRQFPVPVVRDSLGPQLEVYLEQLRAASQVAKLMKFTTHDNLPAATVLISPYDSPEARKSKLHEVLREGKDFAYLLPANDPMQEKLKQEGRAMIQKGLRLGRRNTTVCLALVAFARSRNLPEEELRVLELLHRTFPPKPDVERESQLRKLLAGKR